MKQWKNERLQELRLDKRTEKDIRQRIHELAASYVPEWKFDEDNPDIGSVIAIIYAKQMAGNVEKYNELLKQYQIDFVNMLGISLLPAIPSSTMVCMEVADDSISGVPVPKGAKLLAKGEDEVIIFETDNNVYVTNSKLVSMFMTSVKDGKIMPVMGHFTPVSYVEEMAEDTDSEQEYRNFPITLFEFNQPGLEKHALLLYHSSIFDVEENEIHIEFAGGEALVQGIIDGTYRLWYYTKDGLQPVDCIEKKSDTEISISKTQSCGKVKQGEREYSLFVIEAQEYPTENVTASDILLSSEGKARKPEFVSADGVDREMEDILPFGDNLALFKEFYIGHNEFFHKPGARITIDFDLHFRTQEVHLTRQQEEEELKIVKKKPRVILQDMVAETFPQEVMLEYYNGIGWKRLECERPYQQIFASGRDDKCSISFVCPQDWVETTVGANAGRCIRMVLTKADNCYMRPCTHHYPVLNHLTITYSYENRFVKPEKVVRISDTIKEDLSKRIAVGVSTVLFGRGHYSDTALYMGFDKKMETGPISMLFELNEDTNFQGSRFSFYYSTAKGFERLKIADYTNGMTNTNRIIFLPPADMAPLSLEGNTCYWIKLVDDKNILESDHIFRPQINRIYMNVVEASNTETLPEDDYYIDEVNPYMQFALYADNILSLRLWVNETEHLSNLQMQKLLAEEPQNVRVEYNTAGNIERFMVKWQEVENFDCSKNGARHYILDRMNSVLMFGDGVNAQIPRNTRDIAFTVGVTCCKGAKANLEPESIYGSMDNLMFINRVYNPLKSFGGSNMERMETALKRGANMISSRTRLVSLIDYEREVLSWSQSINQVKAVVGRTKDGIVDEQAISLVILFDDYLKNPQTFYHVQGRLKEHLLEHCEMSIRPEKLYLVAPLFVEISVEIWLEINDMDETFELSRQFKERLETYLDPYAREGWEIGKLPLESQIRLLLYSEKKGAMIRQMMVVASYQDHTGRHEYNLCDLEVTPFMMCRSGAHKIHFIQK